MREVKENRDSSPAANSIRSMAVISSIAFSIANFRGPLIKELVARGVRVYALAPDYDEKTRAAVVALGAEAIDISLERTGMRPIRDGLDTLRLLRLLRRLRPDAVFSYFIKPVIYGSIAARLAGIPHRFALVAGLGYVFTPDGEREPLKRRILRGVVSELYKWGFAACDRIFFQNNEDVAHFVDGGILSRNKALRVSGSGIDLRRLYPAPPVTEPVTFLLMARLLREKGIAEYAAAARKIKAVHPHVRFLLLGDLDPNPGGFSQSEVEAWVREGLFEWPGQVDDVRQWIAQASVYVLPSYREGLPRSTQEAMAMGRPVITTDSVGCRETVDEGVNGYLVPVRDHEALAAAMLRFIDRPELIATMGVESRRFAEEHFDVHKINALIFQAMGIGSSDSNNLTSGAFRESD